ncbi:HAD-IIB family hydrolase [Herbaspirillum frisingense]|uniref:HAD-IIB family hydrolase n=1 Tax=Herbaspirillum frisingense TaxID=92645 RepID=UPI0012695EEC|nr:HAD family hydrolase [Herbaspirillum frisingense]
MEQGNINNMSSSLTHEPRILPDALSLPADLRAFANVKLIAFDLDGTLISHHAEAPGDRLVDLFLAFRQSKVLLTLATGRTLKGVSVALGQLKNLAQAPLVLYNGSVVMKPEDQTLIAHIAISRHFVESFLDQLRGSSDVSAFLYCVDPEANFIGGGASTEVVYFAGSGFDKAKEFNGMTPRPITDFRLESAEVVAILVESRTGQAREQLLKYLQQANNVSITSSGTKYIEIRPAGSSKAVGMQWLCDRYQINPMNVLAVGDNDNDVELLSWAGISVSVGGASDAARRASKYYSQHGAGKAAIEILEIVKHAQRLFKGGRKNGGKS